jgi:DNA-binding transcriptional LysR family regulator
MLKLESVAAFIAIAEAGSISGAARRMELSKSVISQRLSELERSLGATLLHRTTRNVSITEDGKAFYERARRIVQDVADATAEIAERRRELAGPLRISAPVSFGILHLGPALYGFLARHAKIELTLDLDDRLVSVVAGGYDALVRHGPILDEQLIVKRLALSRRFLVAAPGYLKKSGTPKTVRELKQHKAIVYSNRGAADWRFKAQGKLITVQPETVVLRVNSGLLMRDAAAAGLGIALLPGYFIQTELARKKLVIVDLGVEAEGATLCIAYPHDRRRSAKLRALTEWLREAFGNPPYWDAPLPVRR